MLVRVCVCCFFMHAVMQPLKTCQSERWGESKRKRDAAMCQTSQDSPQPPLFQMREMRYAIALTAELNPKHHNNIFRSSSILLWDPLWVVPANAPSFTQKGNKILEFSTPWKKKSNHRSLPGVWLWTQIGEANIYCTAFTVATNSTATDHGIQFADVLHKHEPSAPEITRNTNTKTPMLMIFHIF